MDVGGGGKIPTRDNPGARGGGVLRSIFSAVKIVYFPGHTLCSILAYCACARGVMAAAAAAAACTRANRTYDDDDDAAYERRFGPGRDGLYCYYFFFFPPGAVADTV